VGTKASPAIEFKAGNQTSAVAPAHSPAILSHRRKSVGTNDSAVQTAGVMNMPATLRLPQKKGSQFD
jgi:hypothetical protein